MITIIAREGVYFCVTDADANATDVLGVRLATPSPLDWSVIPAKGLLPSLSVARWRQRCGRVQLPRHHRNFAPSRGTNANLSVRVRRSRLSSPSFPSLSETESNLAKGDSAHAAWPGHGPTDQHERESGCSLRPAPHRPAVGCSGGCGRLRPAGRRGPSVRSVAVLALAEHGEEEGGTLGGTGSWW